MPLKPSSRLEAADYAAYQELDRLAGLDDARRYVSRAFRGDLSSHPRHADPPWEPTEAEVKRLHDAPALASPYIDVDV